MYYQEPGQEVRTFHVKLPAYYPEKREVMYDIVGNQKCDFNPVDHWKLLGAQGKVEWIVNGVDPNQVTYQFSLGGFPCSTIPETLLATDFFTIQELDDFAAEAEDSFRTVVDDDSSFINNIIEMIEMCEGNIRALKDLGEKFKKAWATFFKVLQSTGSYYVAWRFAIKPLIRDVQNFLTMVSRARKRLKWLKANNHRITRVRFMGHKKDIEDPTFGFGDIAWVQNDPNYPMEVLPAAPPNSVGFLGNISGFAQLNAWADVKFDVPDYLLDDMILAMGMIMMTMQGIYNPLKIIWEAIPFSWLIEWFTNKRIQLQKELASLDPFGTATIYQTGWSMKMKIFGFVSWVGSDPDQHVEIGDFLFKRYLRRPGLPTGDSSIFAENPLDLGRLGILGGIAGNWRHRRD